MISIFQTFDFNRVFIEPWTVQFTNTWAIVLMGFLVSAGCGLVGNYIILRKMALVGDAISHSLLPGIAIAFLIAGKRDTTALFLGAIVAGVITVALIEFIHKHSKIKTDAAIGIVFSSLFAIGIIIITLFADHIDLDTECVLYGELAFIPLNDSVMVAGMNLGPYPIVRMAMILLGLIAIISVFYKELLVSTFDAGLARCIGVKPQIFHYGLTFVLSLVIVSAFKSVGAILVVAMLLFPGCTARLMTNNLKSALWITIILSGAYAFLGFHLATWQDCSIAAAMSVCALIIFASVQLFKLIKTATTQTLH